MLPRRLVLPLLVPLVLMAVGTIGYMVIEYDKPWTALDAFYMTGITLTTVGFREVHDLSPRGQLFTVFLCFGGIFTLFYFAGEFIRAVVSGEFQTIVGRQQMEQSLARIEGHTIICGYGRMGRRVCKEFEELRERYVLIDRRDELTDLFPTECGLFVHGDATDDDVLKHAGIERAKSLVIVLPDDAENLYVALSGRLLAPEVFIVARAESEAAESKLKRVGANNVVSPFRIGGSRVAQVVLRPAVTDFIELATRTDYLEMQIEEVRLRPESVLVGRELSDVRMQQTLGVIVVAIRDPSGDMMASPDGSTVLRADTTLIALGRRQQLDELERLAAGEPDDD